MIELQAILSMNLLGSKSAGDLDEHSLALLTCEMENLVLRIASFAAATSSDPRRTRGVVIQRLKANLKTTHKSRSNQGHSGVRFRNAVQSQLPSLVSPTLRPFGGSAGVVGRK